MRDGRTRAMKRCKSAAEGNFLDDHRITLVVMNGPAAGSEFRIDREKIVLGRGPGVDLAFRDSAMSSEHVAIEILQDGCRARDLASTNGMWVNGSQVLLADLKHGDSLELGEHKFQLLVERAERDPNTFVVPES